MNISMKTLFGGAVLIAASAASSATIIDMEDFGTKYLNYLNGVYDEKDEKWDDSIYSDAKLFEDERFAAFFETLSDRMDEYYIDADRKILNMSKIVADYNDYLSTIADEEESGNSSLDLVSGTFDSQFKKAQVVNGILYDAAGQTVAGTVQVKASKINKQKSITISATVKLFTTGKKLTAKTKLRTTGDSGSMSFRSPIGVMAIELADDGTFSLAGDDYFMQEGGEIGGKLDTDSLTFEMDGDEEPDFGEDWCLLGDAIPNGAKIEVKNGTKWDCGKAPTIKYKKIREDREVFYELVGLDDETKTNYSGLKLTYSYKTGEFKGSFKLYASNECSDSSIPKLKKYSVSVSGIVVDGVGYGTAILKKPACKWTVVIE